LKFLDPERMGLEARIFDLNVLSEFVSASVPGGRAVMRREVGDYVNLFWPNFAHWSGMLWDPQRFPMMTYEFKRARKETKCIAMGDPYCEWEFR
jgi:hypothetical protein